MTRALRAAALAAGLAAVCAAALRPEPLPPAPSSRVSDRAGVLSASGAAAIEAKLAAFEREQGTQIVVALFDRLPADEALEDWTSRVAQAWRIGREGKDDGVVLFAFVAERRLRMEVGYGLEGALTDLESKVILEEVLVPSLRRGDWDGGVAATVDAIAQAVRGEYQADPRRARGESGRKIPVELVVLIVIVLFLMSSNRRRRGRSSRAGGWGGWGGPWGGGGFGGGFGGGGFGGGGFGGGGFSGGGGSFGGGGASGRW